MRRGSARRRSIASWYSRTRPSISATGGSGTWWISPRTHHPRMRPCGTQPVREQERTVLARDAAEGLGGQASASDRTGAAGQYLGAAGIGHGKRAITLSLVDQGLDILLVQANALRQKWQFEFGAYHVRSGLLQNGDRSFEMLHRSRRLMLLERDIAESRMRFPHNRRIVFAFVDGLLEQARGLLRNRPGRLRSAPRFARCSTACAGSPHSSAE